MPSVRVRMKVSFLDTDNKVQLLVQLVSEAHESMMIQHSGTTFRTELWISYDTAFSKGCLEPLILRKSSVMDMLTFYSSSSRNSIMTLKDSEIMFQYNIVLILLRNVSVQANISYSTEWPNVADTMLGALEYQMKKRHKPYKIECLWLQLLGLIAKLSICGISL